MTPRVPKGTHFKDPIVVEADPRPPTNGTLKSAHRQLVRLSVPDETKLTKLNTDALVIDFGLFVDSPMVALFREQQQNPEALEDVLSDDLQRGGATHRGCAYLTRDEDGRWRVSEYVVRLPRPGGDLNHKTVANGVADLVREVGPPAPRTNVWVRLKLEALGGGYSTVRRGQNAIVDALNDPYPHVGAREADVDYPTLVAFVADLKRAYADEFDPPAFE